MHTGSASALKPFMELIDELRVKVIFVPRAFLLDWTKFRRNPCWPFACLLAKVVILLPRKEHESLIFLERRIGFFIVASPLRIVSIL